ncbi:calpain-9-like [Physella acuta]|uniref:calpain-9-like n=1 Tax=Physella acuta TaxID=109671 RepID=UPI0027DE8043|nr:calpain-9-like [Physella acuta]
MAAAYSQKVSGRLGAQTQKVSSGSQPNLTGTLNRTQVERRPAQFISARSRLDSESSLLDGRSSPNTLKRTAKSQDRLNSSSSTLGGSRSNLAQLKPGQRPSFDDDGRNNAPYPQQPGNSPNYTNVPTYKNNSYNDNDTYSQVSRDRNSHNSTSSFSSVSSREAAAREPAARELAAREPAARDPGAVPRSIPTTPTTPLVQDSKFHEFEKVRVDYMRRGKLYEDTVFLPSNTSVYFSREPPIPLEWTRAKDIARSNRQAAKFFLNNIDNFDIVQGELGDCWFVAALASLVNPDHRALFERVVPPGQSFVENWYSGVFRFNFWHFGQWKQILVDDLLPTSRGKLVFVHSTQLNEFWSALMEKAYAKLYGSFEALKGGQLIDALADMTGGVAEHYDIKGALPTLPANIVNILYKALDRMSLISCNIDSLQTTTLANGLVTRHTYSITDLRSIRTGQQPVNLIRLRDPLGHNEWRGRWSERSQEWQQISLDDKSKLGLIIRDDGEFWMDLEDFLATFDTLEICNLPADAPLDVPKRWHTVEHHGRWIESFNAGGRPIKEGTHWSNPQYLLQLYEVDEDEQNLCTVIVQLMQKDRRKIKQKGEQFLYIGFCIYPCEKGYSLPLNKEYFDHHREVASSGSFLNARQITKRVSLPPGEYVIVPCTWDPNETSDYYIRFFFEKKNMAQYCDDKPEKTDVSPSSPLPEPKAVEENFRSFFYRISGEDMELNSFDLCDAINENLKRDSYHYDVSLEACKSFVALMDSDGSGRIGFPEFQVLWSHIRNWKKVFLENDVNNSGLIDSRDLRPCVNALGYKISNKTLASLIFCFADKSGKIRLDDFLMLMSRLMKSFNTYQEFQKDGVVTLSLDQWLEKSVK